MFYGNLLRNKCNLHGPTKMRRFQSRYMEYNIISMLVHNIITINNLACMLKYHVLDCDISQGRHLRRGTRLGSARQN